MTVKKKPQMQSWESVARDLANRLIYHDFCPEIHPITRTPKHPHWDQGLLEDCPSCEDRYAMECYYARRMDKPQPPRPERTGSV